MARATSLTAAGRWDLHGGYDFLYRLLAYNTFKRNYYILGFLDTTFLIFYSRHFRNEKLLPHKKLGFCFVTAL
jgi:hypothetical protein